MGEVLILMEGIEKRFPGVHALNDCSFELRSGEVHALVGENGAGKSTLMKILGGIYHKDAGQIYLKNRAVDITNPRQAQQLGMEGKITVIGYDSGQQQIDAIRSGAEAGAITQNPIGIGYKCVEAAFKAYNGETLPETIDTGFMWYDASNIDDEEIQAVLYK